MAREERLILRTLSVLLLTALVFGCGGGGSSSENGAAAEAPPMPTPCSPASALGGPYCLTFTGSGYAGTHAGQKFKVALVLADGSNTVVASQIIPALPSSGFALNFPQVMANGVAYYVDYYADENSSTHCESPPEVQGGITINTTGDHVWRSHIYLTFFSGTVTTVVASGADVTWNTVHDDPFLDPTTGPAMDTCPQLNP